MSFSHRRPVSILKSTRRMPTPRKTPERKSLTRMASAMMSSISCGVAQPKAVTCSSDTIGSSSSSRLLLIELDDRARQLRALLDAEALRQRAGRDVAHHNLERNDLHLADQLLAHVHPADEVRRHADLVQVLEHVLRDAIVQHALTFDHLMLLGIEGGRVVLEVLDQGARLGSFVENLRLAFIDTATAAHRDVPWLEEIHWVP